MFWKRPELRCDLSEGKVGWRSRMSRFRSQRIFRPVLAGLPNDKCQVPHWGYVIKGKVTLEYEDGVVESYESGQVYYQPPGHTGQAEAGTETIEFSPDEEFAGLLEHFRSKMGG